ncbi:MAG: hypothetical protein O2854_02495 [Chloroflexi bacterium]|nr:hypothetical protein [Chloroflexota bacterium]
MFATKRKLIVAGLLAIAASLAAQPVFAHGLGDRYDLPIPLTYFVVGAVASVALSFVVVGLFVQGESASYSYPRYNLLQQRWFSWTLGGPWFIALIRAFSVVLLLLVVATAFGGTNRPLENFSPTFVLILWWVGFGYISAVFGNVWMFVNPWKITYEWIEGLVSRGRRRPYLYRYPKKWGVWPAVILFLLFAWMENVYSGISEPAKLGTLVILYSFITWLGMFIYGKHVWLKNGEAFSVLFGIFSRFSPTEVRVIDAAKTCRKCQEECEPVDGTCVDCYACFERAESENREFNVRPYALGLARPEKISNSMLVFVVLMLATVSFDGLGETSAWNSVIRFFQDNVSVGITDTVNTFGLLLAPVAFLIVYAGFSWLMRAVSGVPDSTWRLARLFVFSLVPIALAYHISHYLSFLTGSGQLIIPLISDPFGFGWDLFGTADYRFNPFIINAKFVWFTSIVAIVLGHIIAVYLAHLVSLREIKNHSQALRSQYPMLALMVVYTATSLWIIAQPLVGIGS